MRERTCKRYYCDWCNKAGMQRGAMEKHEKHCTLNPNRDCRMCAIITGGHPLPMDDLKRMLPAPKDFENIPFNHHTWTGGEDKLVDAVKLAMPALRELVDNCPACIMAALRQRDIPVPMVEGFDFAKECAAVFATRNEERYCEY
jgi:hypothetical protein